MAREPVYDVLTGLVRTLLWWQGLRIDIRGQEHIPRSGGAVLAVNHTAYLDFMEVGLVGRRSGRNVRYMMKAELEHGIVGFLMKHCKAIGVDRSAGAESFGRAVDSLREGELVVVYPEATISRSFELKELKSGAARMALEAGVPIIPLAIWGAQRIWTKDVPKQLGRHRFPITIRIGEPLPPVGTPDELTATLRTALRTALDTAQRDYPDPPTGARWAPVRLGGTAPTLEQAAEIERAELEARRARRAERA
ncbi:1-acyl-sn-glycerol-3-phosphate acyltransferase [Nocardia puris]|uniref:lysophospholipid acyltransferase family protein n=1 Tax=Nocardia puris TaxID=208602 RepID=UPI0018931B3E|nr:lysophospholipid acyltransferase family protein [Nocardia puris]MBF6214226.1 1-acyl-sn-glycerol-3-phosphate acyltransferase [Nocardia puris]MBF6365284.1 1-acyl-sn-glycerol-3-phosphate acyltransferase [Nocardia puris]MBF6459686.1 1-acyl-sn-glycerol-3-phosphate acyltransferase [Nocardia puris]